MSVDRLDTNEVEAFSSVLAFFGSQATSHAGLTLGFVVGLLTLVQIRFSDKYPMGNELVLVVVLVLVFFVVWGLVHSLVRILQYGALSGAVRHSSVASYRKMVHDKGWGDMIPHGKASMFVEEHLRQTWWLRWLISNKRMPFVISFLVALSLWIGLLTLFL